VTADAVGPAAVGPLVGLRVIEISTMMAGPYGATLLGDLGADVIKVESHFGDDSRRLGAMRDGECGPFLSLNRNKRAVVIDMLQPQGREVFARLAATTDIIISNVREPALSKLGLSYEQVKVHRPDIIWIGLSSPQQEKFMAEHGPSLEAGLLIGVGAAFDFLSGRVPQAPRWMQRSGLEWFHRLCTDPARLWPRYLIHNPCFVLRVCAQLLGLKRYPLDEGDSRRSSL